MFKVSQLAAGLVTVGLVFAGGCAAKTNESKTQTDSNAASKVNAKPPLSAQATVQAVLEKLKASKPVALWDALDPSLQVSLNERVRELASAIDPDVWNGTVRDFTKLVDVLETKKDFLLDSPLWVAAGIKRADLKANWGPVVKMLKTISQSELVDREKMTNFDGRTFFDGPGPVLYAEAHELFRSSKDDPLKGIENLKVSVRESNDQTATLLLQPPDPKAKPIEFQMFADRGQWTSLVLSYAGKTVADRIASYQKLFTTYYMADWKDEYLADLERLGKGLDQLKAAKTSDEFQAVVGRDVFPLLLRRIAQFRNGIPKHRGLKAVSYQRKASTALVVVKGTHSAGEPAMLALTNGFNRLVPPPQKVSFPEVVDGMTVVLVGPIEDVSVLASSVKSGKVVKADAKMKTLTVEVPEVAASEVVPGKALPKSGRPTKSRPGRLGGRGRQAASAQSSSS